MEKTMVNSKNKLVIVTGPESTGKTSIALKLSEKFNGEYMPEYARSYISSLNRMYNVDDILHIAEYQKNDFDKVQALESDKYFFIDTYLIITKIWFLWHAGKYPLWIDKAIKSSNNCLYLLCAPDIEWQADGVRENGGENRMKLFEAYKQELINNKLPFQVVTGINGVRYENAVNFVKEFWTKK
jgi:NadR type nicotinamide-nucleotide adenylyltransferase